MATPPSPIAAAMEQPRQHAAAPSPRTSVVQVASPKLGFPRCGIAIPRKHKGREWPGTRSRTRPLFCMRPGGGSG